MRYCPRHLERLTETMFTLPRILRTHLPEEYARYYPAYAAVNDDEALAERVRLLNTLEFIGTEEKTSRQSIIESAWVPLMLTHP